MLKYLSIKFLVYHISGSVHSSFRFFGIKELKPNFLVFRGVVSLFILYHINFLQDYYPYQFLTQGKMMGKGVKTGLEPV